MGRLSKILLILFRIIAIVAPFVVLSYFIYKDFVASGVLVAEYDFKSASPFISVLRPNSRVSEIARDDNGQYYQKIINQPVYFDVRLPRNFAKAEVMLQYKNIDQPIFEVGAMTDKEKWSFDLLPVENKIINFLLQDKLRWSYMRDGNTLLFQKSMKYKSVKDFLENLPPRDKIAVYNYKLKKDFTLPKYIPSENGIEINKTLRGGYRMYAYIKKKPLNFIFWIQDVNRHIGDDYIGIDVYKDDEAVYSSFVKIDSNTSDNRAMSEVKEVKVFLPDISEGVYRIELTSPSDDIFTRRIQTIEDYLVLTNKIYLGDNVGYSDEYDKQRKNPTTLFTDGKFISAFTTHVEGLQTLLVNNKTLKLDETHKKFYSNPDFSFKKILVPSNDISIETRGMLSFSEKEFFNPELMTLADGENFDTEAIQYVITNYPISKLLNDDWKEINLSFDLERYYTQDKLLHLVLSLPYLEEGEGGIMIRKIKVDLKGAPLGWNEMIKKVEKKLGEFLP